MLDALIFLAVITGSAILAWVLVLGCIAAVEAVYDLGRPHD